MMSLFSGHFLSACKSIYFHDNWKIFAVLFFDCAMQVDFYIILTSTEPC